MDTLLNHGDHAVDSRGIPIVIHGADELMQRALIRLGVRRGHFFDDPELGSELYRLPAADNETVNRLALSYVQEALLPLTGLRVASVDCARFRGDTLQITVGVSLDDKIYQLEVEV